MTVGFKSVGYTEAFKRDYRRLDLVTQSAVDLCIEDLYKNPIPSVRRFHCVDANKPKLFTVDVFSNKSYKVSLQIENSTAILRRVSTHKVIDRNP